MGQNKKTKIKRKFGFFFIITLKKIIVIIKLYVFPKFN